MTSQEKEKPRLSREVVDRLLEKSAPSYPWRLVRHPPLNSTEKMVRAIRGTYTVVTVVGFTLAVVLMPAANVARRVVSWFRGSGR